MQAMQGLLDTAEREFRGVGLKSFPAPAEVADAARAQQNQASTASSAGRAKVTIKISQKNYFLSPHLTEAESNRAAYICIAWALPTAGWVLPWSSFFAF